MADKKTDLVAPANNVFNMTLRPGETEAAAVARQVINPAVRSVMTIADYPGPIGMPKINEALDALSAKIDAVKGGDMQGADEMLVSQAVALDALFHSLARRSLLNSNGGFLGASESYMRLALKAQSQARATWESLSKIKNPMGATFVRQANIANGPQQVNNGCEPSRTGNIESKQNELLEHEHGERLDTGAKGAAGGSHPTVEAVGTIHRPTKRSRQGSGKR